MRKQCVPDPLSRGLRLRLAHAGPVYMQCTCRASVHAYRDPSQSCMILYYLYYTTLLARLEKVTACIEEDS